MITGPPEKFNPFGLYLQFSSPNVILEEHQLLEVVEYYHVQISIQKISIGLIKTSLLQCFWSDNGGKEEDTLQIFREKNNFLWDKAWIIESTIEKNSILSYNIWVM